MGTLDDLPTRHKTHDTGHAAEVAFEAAIEEQKLFAVQSRDRSDYGTDVQIEARRGEAMTNFRAHVQLKGTESAANADGSVSVSIERTTLNYLLGPPHSCFACYHLPTERLLVRAASDVHRDYERGGTEWTEQKEITVRFSEPFDAAFQRLLHGLVLTAGRATRDRRNDWSVTPPEELASVMERAVAAVDVPMDQNQARAILEQFYKKGDDAAICAAFDQFEAVLEPAPGAMDHAYMAKVNLGIHGSVDEPRVREAIRRFQDAIARDERLKGSLLFCQGNAWMALGDDAKAREVFETALESLMHPSVAGVAAQCCKNLGTVLSNLGDDAAARHAYERALVFNPKLGEANLALALWHRRRGTEPKLALEHLDRVRRGPGSRLQMATVQGWRVELLFKTGDSEGAFNEIDRLLAEGDRLSWALQWSAQQVAKFGRASVEAARRAVPFWEEYLRQRPGDLAAERQRLFCIYRLHCGGIDETDWQGFRDAVERADEQDAESALLWDRVGHWAQDDKRWPEATEAYRRAFDVDPDLYGYCLGTALNFLDRHEEALPMLLAQAETHQPDAKSWFQVAIAREGVRDTAGCIAAYERALELDADYDLAWFNLGGVHFNAADKPAARATWTEALKRFPEHPLAVKAREILPTLLDPD